MNAAQQAAVREVIAGVDTALMWLEVEVARMQRSLDAGIEYQTLAAINAAIVKAKRP